jgi:formyltetrahydrofolate-dependent phosphoribosylglycinamide formyltransferase
MADDVRLAVLLSGSGRTLENFLAKIAGQELPVRIVAVVSSRGDVRGVTVAREAGLPCGIFRRKDYDSVAAHNRAINDWLAGYRPEMIALAGYLCFYIAPDRFAGPVVNIHPALLPRYGGQGYFGNRVHRAVLGAGDTETGCTVHLVDEQYDHGRILGQKKVPVLPDDDVDALAARVFGAECEIYPAILADLARGIRSSG